jgi:hypothetical protein
MNIKTLFLFLIKALVSLWHGKRNVFTTASRAYTIHVKLLPFTSRSRGQRYLNRVRLHVSLSLWLQKYHKPIFCLPDGYHKAGGW